MREVRVESVEGLEMLGGAALRLSANAGDLEVVFPREIWERILASASEPTQPTEEELAELESLRNALAGYAREHSFNTVLEGVQCGGSELEYDLVLRPGGLFAATTGYHFAPVVVPDLMARVGTSLEDDDFVEQAYVIGAVADAGSLAAGDDALRTLSMRGRWCSTSRFEMAPELWRTLHEKLGWKDVKTVATEKR
jgi:hypothetical protein